MVKHIYEMDDYEIEQIIHKYLQIRDIEKNKFGEVFTPIELINLILDEFPNKCWSNYNAKWFEPSAGIGNFMIIIYKRLMDGLKSWQPNKQKRSEHIIQNMLYMVELNKDNCNICKTIFGSQSNLICGDFLDDNTLFKNLTFDYIVGNPPFQDEFNKTNINNNNNNKRILGGKSKLYERIFLKAFELLKQGGYLSFITPDNIFSGNGVKSYKTLIQNDVQFINFNSINQYFPTIQQHMCYFMLHKSKNMNKTIIQSDTQTKMQIQLRDRPVNPIRDWNRHTEFLTNKYISNIRNSAVYNRGKRVSEYKGNKYTIIYTPSKNLYTNKSEFAVGYDQPKIIIFTISPNLEFKMDYKGQFGVGPNTFYIPFKTVAQGKLIEHFFNSQEYKTLALATKTTRQYLKIAFIEYLNVYKIMKTNKTKKTEKKFKKNRQSRQSRKTRKNNI